MQQRRWETRLEVLVERERLRGHLGRRALRRRVDTRLGVVGDALLEEVRLALERDHVHEVEGVRHVVHLRVAERDEEAIGDKLDVLAHECRVHADEATRECICESSQKTDSAPRTRRTYQSGTPAQYRRPR